MADKIGWDPVDLAASESERLDALLKSARSLANIDVSLERIADALEQMGGTPGAYGPGYERPIGEFQGFDFSLIGARIAGQDREGPTQLEYRGRIYTRRLGQPKYGPWVSYSRSTGQHDAEGKVIYDNLITFKKMPEVEPLTDQIRQALPPGENVPALPQHTPPDPVSYGTYARRAAELNLAREAWEPIGAIFDVKDKGGDWTRPYRALDFFAAAKRHSLTFTEAVMYIENANGDPARALEMLEPEGDNGTKRRD